MTDEVKLLNKCSLVVLNHCMDSGHPSLGHQFSVVTQLAKNFSSVEVLTTSYSGESLPSNVSVTTIPWKPGKPFHNARRLWLAFLKVCMTRKPNFVFSHMSPLSSIAVASLARLCRIPHILWYAHAHRPRSLQLAVSLVDAVVSSTTGSFPLKTSKLLLIGQGVDARLFTKPDTSLASRFDMVYAGRMDSSKNVMLIVSKLAELKTRFPDIRLTLIGNGSSIFVNDTNRDWVTAKESVRRDNLPEQLSKHGTFIHAFIGSLDKVLVEAAMMQLPIISINPEFLREFETFSPSDFETSLDHQLSNYFVQNSANINQVVLNNLEIAKNNHELSRWVSRLTNAIKLSA
jgi:glycosyltransferase involved in cell wall biosynthesis